MDALVRLQLISETTDCDYKAAVERTKPKSWLKSVSAFANTAGGVLAFGIDDVTHSAIGLADAQADADFISEKIKERIGPLPRFEIEAVSESGRDVLLVSVRADAHPPHYYTAATSCSAARCTWTCTTTAWRSTSQAPRSATRCPRTWWQRA